MNGEDFTNAAGKDKLVQRFFMETKNETLKRPLNIAVIGQPGVGKSSLINSLIASLKLTKWEEYAMSGGFGGKSGQMTCHLERISPKRYYPEKDENLLPVFVDMCGFPEIYTTNNSDKMKEILRLIFLGKLHDGESVQNILTETDSLCDVRSKYGNRESKYKIDRIVFVASCTDPPPTMLMSAVRSAAQSVKSIGIDKIRIPIYGIMTFADKVDSNDSDFIEREKTFKSCLGLLGCEQRFEIISNYCGDVDPIKQRMETCIPKLDLPFLRFMIQVCSPALERSEEIHEDEISKRKEMKRIRKMEFLLSVIKGIIFYYILNTYEKGHYYYNSSQCMFFGILLIIIDIFISEIYFQAFKYIQR